MDARGRRVHDHGRGAVRSRARGTGGADPPGDLDKNVVLADGATIGVDRDRDLARGFTVTDSGITIVGKGVHVEA